MNLLGRVLTGSLPYYQELHEASQAIDGDSNLKLNILIVKTGERLCAQTILLLADIGRELQIVGRAWQVSREVNSFIAIGF